MDLAERQQLLALAQDAALEAGEILVGHLGHLDPEAIGLKTNYRDLVTAADLDAERVLVDRLRKACPGHAIEAEEETRDAMDGRPRWFLDPLDGTVNFIHRLPCFAVSMGLWVDGQPQVSVIHAPVLGETFSAVRGGGAWLGDRPMKVSPVETIRDAVLATGFAYRRSELNPSNLEQFASFFHEARGLRRMGSAALDLAFVADGRLDGYWEYHLSPHDVAAGGLLVLEAGGSVTDVGGGEDWLRGGSIVAAGPALHGAMTSHLARVGTGE
ncbi:MAG: inositol monophosphatase family protein [Planctomycetota bacterium]|jgi:myo-inositol-1(or 4)-monophosphatase|nr:inositol monophosphatase family protein [Planctomycetota bacterium]